MKKLVIAEKPSVAADIARTLGKAKKHDDYYENDDFVISSALGHLRELPMPADIDKKYARWSLSNLPILPEKFTPKPIEKTKKKFQDLKKLMARKDLDGIINACDAGREGEIIVRLIIMHSGCGSKPLKRLWLNDQTAETVAKGLSELKDEREYNNLAYEGFARTCIDWLYGVNLTRYATLRSGRLLRVGRVIVPIVRAIYDRDTEIENFRPEKYFIARSIAETNGEKVELCGKDRFQADKKEECEELCRRYNQAGATVTDVKKKKTVIAFILVPQVKMPKLINFATESERWQEKVPSLILENWSEDE